MTVTTLDTDLGATARRLTERGRGILAADESPATMSTRLDEQGIATDESTRRAYRQLLLSAPELSPSVSGIILSDETFRQQLSDGRGFPEAAADVGILAGVKVDTGTVALAGSPGTLVTQGLDGLAGRLEAYADAGAAFTKWRAVIDVTTATEHSIRTNAQALARYAALCQQHGLVPIVEPEVLAAGTHDLVACAVTTRLTLRTVFAELERADVDLAGIVLKPNFVTPGLSCQSVSAQTVATVTFDVLRDAVPESVPGIAFLSGGHSTKDACAYLQALNANDPAPWAMTFSFGRALVSEALTTWAGSPANVSRAQGALVASCRRAAAATG